MNPVHTNGTLTATMVRNLCLAQEHYVRHHKSRHWDIFPPDFADRVSNSNLWPEFRNNGLSSGFDAGRRAAGQTGPFINNSPAMKKSVEERYWSLVTRTGRPFIETYGECRIGNPVRTEIDGLQINPTDLRLLHDAWQVNQLLHDQPHEELCLIDIGGGFGGAAAKYKRLFPKARVLIFDLPEVNVAQTYYLSTLFPSADILTFEQYVADPSRLAARAFDFAILPGWCIADVPPATADAIVNTRSMMEMDPETIQFYFDHIQRICREDGLFYCVNRYYKDTVGQAIRIKDYPFDDRWIARLSQPAWDQPWIHELAVIRTPWPVAYPVSSLLDKLPPRQWDEVAVALRRVGDVLRIKLLGDHIMITPGPHHRAILFWKRFRHDSVKWAHDIPAVKAVLRPLYRGLRAILKLFQRSTAPRT